MPRWGVRIRRLYATSKGAWFGIQSIRNGDPFDVVAVAELGENLNESVDSYDLVVSVRNLTQSITLLGDELRAPLTPQDNLGSSFEIKVPFNGGWTATEGDVLKAVASLRVLAGSNSSQATAESDAFVVT